MNATVKITSPRAVKTGKSRLTAAGGRTGMAAGLCLVQLVLAYEWLLSGVNKLLNQNFTVQLASTLHQNISGNPYGWYVSLLRGVVLPHANVFGVLTELGELSIGVTLLASAVLWMRFPAGRPTMYAGIAACAALAGATFMPLNYFLMSGDPIPWINPANAFNEGVSIDVLMSLLAVALLVANLNALKTAAGRLSGAGARAQGDTSWAA